MTQIKSDGSSSSYYALTITNKAGQSIDVETGDIIRALVGNDFDLSNIVKACRRMYEASQGRGKAGSSIEYDANKIVYFAKEFAHWNSTNKLAKESEVSGLTQDSPIKFFSPSVLSYLITDPELMKKISEIKPKVVQCTLCFGKGCYITPSWGFQHVCEQCEGTGEC
jgi:hypothetical protein